MIATFLRFCALAIQPPARMTSDRVARVLRIAAQMALRPTTRQRRCQIQRGEPEWVASCIENAQPIGGRTQRATPAGLPLSTLRTCAVTRAAQVSTASTGSAR